MTMMRELIKKVELPEKRVQELEEAQRQPPVVNITFPPSPAQSEPQPTPWPTFPQPWYIPEPNITPLRPGPVIW